MPKVKRSRKPPPDGWELIEPTLDELDQKMREGKLVESDYPDGAHNTRPSGSRREPTTRSLWMSNDVGLHFAFSVAVCKSHYSKNEFLKSYKRTSQKSTAQVGAVESHETIRYLWNLTF